MTKIYQENVIEQTQIVSKLKRISNVLSLLRLAVVVLFLTSLYQVLIEQSVVDIWQLLIYGSAAVFLILLLIYQRNAKKLAYHKQLLVINKDEFNYLTNNDLPFDNGKEFIDSQHANSFDLDLFGEKSLFQHINRTRLTLGKKKLAQLFTETVNPEEVIRRQKAVQELSEKFSLRQHFSVLSALSEDKEEYMDNLQCWANSDQKSKKGLAFYLSWLFPALFFVLVILYVFDNTLIDSKWIGYLFIINMLSVGFNFKHINGEIQNSSKIAQTLSTYSGLIKTIKEVDFQSDLLVQKQKELASETVSADLLIKKLSRLFEQLDTIANMFVAILLNGLFQYHNHVYYKVVKWKSAHSRQLFHWLNTVADIEALNSVANFAYNNPEYVYPAINENNHFAFQQLGHPLIEKTKRVCNDIDFRQQRLTILTGSNMSGKSTFLRTIGVNLLLTGAGSPVCATEATVCPIPLWVSMRLTDSLKDGESYFYAEVKRLKQIVVEAQQQPVFVLLDEILRGTNSDDKTQGTIGVIEKMVNCGATGMIATHDLEVCTVENKYPNVLTNKSFEGIIANDELSFDYKLRDGICQNKNATFIMKKMEII